MIVVLHNPVNHVARQSVRAGKPEGMAAPDEIQTVACCRPNRPVIIELKPAYLPFAEALLSSIRQANRMILVVGDPALTKTKPQTTSHRISQHDPCVVLVAQFCPRDLLDKGLAVQVIKAQLVADPDAARAITNDANDGSGWNTRYGNKFASLQVDHSTPRGDPNPPGLVLKHGQHMRIWKPILRAIYGDITFVPSVQTVQRAKPDASVAGLQYGTHKGVGHTLFRGDCRNSEFAKTVETVPGSHPDTALTVLEQIQNAIVRETVGMCKPVCSSIMHMQ